MTDTIIKGTGNSRTLKTVPNAAALYPDFDAFLAALVAGTLPIDIGPLNPTGLQQQGTDLTKGNLLTDDTATGMGLTAEATPNDALAKLRALVTTAQNTANVRSRAEFGSYMGTGMQGEQNKNTLTFNIPWELLIISADQSGISKIGIFLYGTGFGMSENVGRFSGSDVYGFMLTASYPNRNTLSWYGYDAYAQLNDKNRTYYYIAIG